MKTVDDLIADILRREGGFVDHPSDRGGPTNMGITQQTLSDWLGRPAGIDEVRGLDEETAREIYATRYFHGPRLDALPAGVQPQCFDIAVNSGPKRAVSLLQKVINLAGFGPVDTDGVAGPQTRRAATRAEAEMGPFLANALADAREEFYRALVARDQSQAVFLKGWLNRCNEFRVEVPA